MRVFLLVLLLGLTTTAVQAAAVAKLSVPGMTCSVCPITVRKALTGLPGVLGAEVDYDSRSAEVTYDPDKVAPGDLLKATADAGYPSRLVVPGAESKR